MVQRRAGKTATTHKNTKFYFSEKNRMMSEVSQERRAVTGEEPEGGFSFV